MERFKLGKLIILGAFAAYAGMAQAADLPTVKEPLLAPEPADAPWFVRVGVAGVLFDSSASLTLGGVGVPGASAKASNNVTALIEIGYFVTPNFSLQLTGGYPPTTNVSGVGTIAALGTLGKATYGPAIVSVNYHYKDLGAFQPYIGIGLVEGIIFATRDGAVHNTDIKSSTGFAVQGGFDYFLNRNWSIFVDAKKLFLSFAATGYVFGAPVTASLRGDPVIVDGGLTYHW